MLVAGIDVGAEVHHVAVVDQSEAVVVKPTAFEETAPGYQELFALLARAGARGGEDHTTKVLRLQSNRLQRDNKLDFWSDETAGSNRLRSTNQSAMLKAFGESFEIRACSRTSQ